MTDPRVMLRVTSNGETGFLVSSMPFGGYRTTYAITMDTQKADLISASRVNRVIAKIADRFDDISIVPFD